jgi:hypothetical protein
VNEGSGFKISVDRGGTLKKKILFIATFAFGVIVGVVSHIVSQHILVQTPPDKWIDTEEETLKRMHGFQVRLDQLEKVRPDSVEALSKQMEAQRGIEDLLTKYREAKQAKFAIFIVPGGALFAGIITGIGAWLVARIKSKGMPDTS